MLWGQGQTGRKIEILVPTKLKGADRMTGVHHQDEGLDLWSFPFQIPGQSFIRISPQPVWHVRLPHSHEYGIKGDWRGC